MIPNTLYIETFIQNSSILFTQLRNEINWREDIKIRKTASFGKPYNYSGIHYPETKIPDQIFSFFTKLSTRIEFVPNNILLNYYYDGNSKMGYHSDDISILENGTGVAIVSLGSSRIMRFKHKLNGNILEIELKPGSLFYMNNKNQEEYLHSVLPSKNATDERISITLRKII